MTMPRRTPLVYVVEDDPTTNTVLQSILNRAGFETAGAFGAAEALAGIRSRHPDLVLLDVNLPDGNGLDICRDLHNGTSSMQMPILFISANEDPASRVKGFEAGGVDYIPKPFSGEEVLARVSTHLRLKQAFEALADLQAERVQRLAGAQETLMPLPSDLPEAQFQVCLRQILNAGGDFYDVIPVGNRVVDYIVADASGHDLAASFWTASLKTLLGEYATAASTPGNVVRSINNALDRILPQGVFFTMILARLNRQTGKLVLVNAGHPPAMILHGDTGEVSVIEQSGDVLGVFSDGAFETTEVKLRKGDRVLLYTDGLIELNGSRESGLIELEKANKAHKHEPLETMVSAVVSEVTAPRAPEDDVVLMGVEL
jgi:phosphoserine phosphatase RsbU/P